MQEVNALLLIFFLITINAFAVSEMVSPPPPQVL